jgi:transposase-like protein
VIDHSGEHLLSELLRLGAQQILQQASENEVDELLGRGWYERSQPSQEQPEKAHRGYRNGYTPVNLKTTQGTITLRRPRVRQAEQSFDSALHIPV